MADLEILPELMVRDIDPAYVRYLADCYNGSEPHWQPPPPEVADIDGRRVVVAGFHRIEAYRILGYQHASVIMVPSVRTLDQARYYAATSNRGNARPLSEDRGEYTRAVRLIRASAQGARGVMSQVDVSIMVGCSRALVSLVDIGVRGGEASIATSSIHQLPAEPETMAGQIRDLAEKEPGLRNVDIAARLGCDPSSVSHALPGRGRKLRAKLPDVEDCSPDQLTEWQAKAEAEIKKWSEILTRVRARSATVAVSNVIDLASRRTA